MKQHVVRAILRDIFQIPSLGISFSSFGILKTSDGILFLSEKIGGKVGENQENLGEWREKFENPCKISRSNNFELT